MPVRLDWYEAEHKNIAYFFEGRWTWEEVYAAIDEAVCLLDSVDYQVNLIIDFRKTNYMASVNFDSFYRIANAPTMQHSNTRQLLVLGANRNVEMMFKVFLQIFPKAGKRYRVLKDEEDLQAILNEEDDS